MSKNLVNSCTQALFDVFLGQPNNKRIKVEKHSTANNIKICGF